MEMSAVVRHYPPESNCLDSLHFGWRACTPADDFRIRRGAQEKKGKQEAAFDPFLPVAKRQQLSGRLAVETARQTAPLDVRRRLPWHSAAYLNFCRGLKGEMDESHRGDL